ncbi:MAG TPA: FUSC family membrane protein [Bacteroidia bacterium]|nr:FUSC family membrane protein [Bacteroidia bacterium]
MQDFVKSYKQFSTSYYVAEGIRMTLGIMIPIIAFSMIGNIRAGITTALGVLCTSLCDGPGPLNHRKNAMLISIGIITSITLLTGFSVHFHWLLALELLIFSFLFSMIGIYGARATSIGIGGLVIMILHIDDHNTSTMILLNSIYVFIGGVWYFFFSLGISRLQPYKLAQQVIGDTILSTAKYMHYKALMYDRNVGYDENYLHLIDCQIDLHTKQNLVREVLFKTRSIVRESTHKGRTLLAIFTDTVDLFEQIMASHINYKSLHEIVEEDILQSFKQTIDVIASELESIGVAMQSGNKSVANDTTKMAISDLQEHFNNYRSRFLNDVNRETLLSLEQVIESIKSIYNRIQIMHRYTSYNPEFNAAIDEDVNRDKFITSTEITLETFLSNLNFNSNIFRYSLRVCLTMLAGYLMLSFLPFGHNYWILLTILVILKPAYSLTKKRNIQRLLGTFIGIVAGAIVLFFIKNEYLLIAIMVFAMVGAYSLMRINYLPFVALMTVYLLISFYLMKTDDFNRLMIDRLIDTAIGSILAFIATRVIPPKWEKEQMGSLIKSCLRANAFYFKYVTESFKNDLMEVVYYKLLRKEAYVALANLSDAFQRMLSEPENKQHKGPEIYNMVVNNHLFLSHTSTLASYLPLLKHKIENPHYTAIVQDTLASIETGVMNSASAFPIKEEVRYILEETEILGESEKNGEQRVLLKAVTEQLQFTNKISKDIHRLLSKNTITLQNN